MDREERIKAPLIIEDVEDHDWQWKIKGTCEAISPTYPVGNISLSKKLYDGPITKGKQYFCVFEDTGLKDSAKDKEKTWNYWWKIVEWDIDDDANDIPPGLTNPVNPGTKPTFDATAGQRYTQFGLNVRTALMQAVGILTVNGEYLGTDEGLKTTSDMILEYLNARVFAESPLVVNAIEAGAVPVSVEEKPDVNELLYTGKSAEEVHDHPSKPRVSNHSMAHGKIDWFIPASISNGKEFKSAAMTNGFELDWIMQKYQELGISKSADFVNEEQGSYLDLLIKLIEMAEKEKGEPEEI